MITKESTKAISNPTLASFSKWRHPSREYVTAKLFGATPRNQSYDATFSLYDHRVSPFTYHHFYF